jgi:hypothetical protein
MTYKELLAILQACPEEVLEQTATVYLGQTDEYLAIASHDITLETNDVLDDDIDI